MEQRKFFLKTKNEIKNERGGGKIIIIMK